MKITIIGGGNMGGAIARGLAKGKEIAIESLIVSDPSDAILQQLQSDIPHLRTLNNNAIAIQEANIVILAVKPWLMQSVMRGLAFQSHQLIVSVAAGVSLDELTAWSSPTAKLFRVVPNTAIAELASMNLIASVRTTDDDRQLLLNLFNQLGMAMEVPEHLIPATTALTSSGIAYALKYIQACMQAGVEMGIKPKDCMRMVAQSVKGAAELILNNDTHPAVEIDKVTTPGGITIKGINELEHAGFTSAIIKAMKATK